jgi:hypothetical protein
MTRWVHKTGTMSEQVLKKDNVKAGLKEILKNLVYEAFAEARPAAAKGAAAGA